MSSRDESARVDAARAALTTHDQLRAANAKGDTFELGYDDLPIDASGWLEWHEEEYQPAHRAWSDAMSRLQEVLGSEFPGRHPFRFRPVCERIVAASNDSTRHGLGTAWERHDDPEEGER